MYQNADADVAESLFAMLIGEARIVVAAADLEKLPKCRSVDGKKEQQENDEVFRRIIKYDKRH